MLYLVSYTGIYQAMIWVGVDQVGPAHLHHVPRNRAQRGPRPPMPVPAAVLTGADPASAVDVPVPPDQIDVAAGRRPAPRVELGNVARLTRLVAVRFAEVAPPRRIEHLDAVRAVHVGPGHVTTCPSAARPPWAGLTPEPHRSPPGGLARRGRVRAGKPRQVCTAPGRFPPHAARVTSSRPPRRDRWPLDDNVVHNDQADGVPGCRAPDHSVRHRRAPFPIPSPSVRCGGAG